jgi:NAD(P)-dependent dehydrogenase (short-subunit alcohol dehydrogenase family)
MSQEKVALITGVSSGIGRAIAGLLSQRGFRVFGTARGKLEPKGPLEAVELISLDVRDDDSVRSCVRTVVDRAGRIDALVNNAGYTLIGSLEETTVEEAKQLFETNFFGVLRMTQAVLPFMRGSGPAELPTLDRSWVSSPRRTREFTARANTHWRATPSRWITKYASLESAYRSSNRVSHARTLREMANSPEVRWTRTRAAAPVFSRRLRRA